jgi:hypothetical protein
MKNGTLIAALGLIVLSNAVALIHAARNRAGEPTAEIVLSDRELSYYDDPEDSGVSLNLLWVNPDAMGYSTVLDHDEEPPVIVGVEKLAELGFDVSMAPEDKRASSFYARQIARTGFVALEYDGPAWRVWSEARHKFDGERIKPADRNKHGAPSNLESELRSSSRLVLIDAASDAEALRARHPDRHTIVIVPAVIGIQLRTGSAASETQAARRTELLGNVAQIPSEIHVPKPFSERFHDLAPASGETAREGSRYRVHLSYGSLLEPWVTDVDVGPPATPR